MSVDDLNQKLSDSGVRGLWIAVFINSGVVMSLVVYVIMLSYTAGQRARQMDINTEVIQNINKYGSPGLSDKMDSINKRMDMVMSQQRDLSTQIEDLRMMVARAK